MSNCFFPTLGKFFVVGSCASMAKGSHCGRERRQGQTPPHLDFPICFFQGWLRLPICFFPGLEKQKAQTSNLLFREPGKSNIVQTFKLLFPGPGKSPICFFPGWEKAKWFRLPICFFPGREKANSSDFHFAFSRAGKKQTCSICFFPAREKEKWFRLRICFFPGREKAKWFRLPFAFSRASKKQKARLPIC